MLPRPTLSLLSLCVAGSLMATELAHAEQGYIIEQLGKGFSFNTQTGEATQKDVSMPGLNAVARKGAFEFRSFWEAGGFRPTLTFNRQMIVNGRNVNDVSRLGGFRFDRNGSSVYVRTTKGPKARVKLIQDGHMVLSWPRLTAVSVLAYDLSSLTLATYDKAEQRTQFYRYQRNERGMVADAQMVGELADCSVLSAKVVGRQIIVQAYCDPVRGSDLLALDIHTGRVETLLATEADELLAPQIKRQKGAFSVLSVSGSQNAKMAYHAITGTLMTGLGEPMSLASDEAGKQSWSQSYRTLALAKLYKKSGHPAFAQLARRAMSNTLANQNANLGLAGRFNPSCGWASRIYSKDKRSPVSFQINQAMISGALLRSCEALGAQCPAKLRSEIVENAVCLVRAYEPYFDRSSGLYRIQYGAPFRFDGIWAPWNWHLTWAVVLDRVGASQNAPALRARAYSIAAKFLKTWALGEQGALWRYWVPRYYEGWRASDKISKHRPKQRADKSPKRYEDINHAGLSLMGLAALDKDLPKSMKRAVRTTLDRLLDHGAILPRDLDGKGPRTPRWVPGAGWDHFAGGKMRARYGSLVPGGASGHKLLAYANLFQPSAEFKLQLTAHSCTDRGCQTAKTWTFRGLEDFLAANPLFSIRPFVGQ
ncbi:MAG: hypothetical protein AAGF81_13075 [Pseudomonadota bacterium]